MDPILPVIIYYRVIVDLMMLYATNYSAYNQHDRHCCDCDYKSGSYFRNTLD